MLGSRWSASVSRAVRLGDSGIDRWTATADLRKYWLPFRRNSLALHATFAHSAGDDPRAFVLGGPWTLRGYRYHDFETQPNLDGSNLFLASLEYRLPFVDYLIFGWPGQWGLTGIGAVAFFDAGSAWYDDVQFFGRRDGEWGFVDLRGDYGLGLRGNVFGLPVKLDWAWRTDLRHTDGNVVHFSIGPDF
jgi:outer membrane protein assembly factor BamA